MKVAIGIPGEWLTSYCFWIFWLPYLIASCWSCKLFQLQIPGIPLYISSVDLSHVTTMIDKLLQGWDVHSLLLEYHGIPINQPNSHGILHSSLGSGTKVVCFAAEVWSFQNSFGVIQWNILTDRKSSLSQDFHSDLPTHILRLVLAAMPVTAVMIILNDDHDSSNDGDSEV